MLIKSKPARKFEKEFIESVPEDCVGAIIGYFKAFISVFYKDRRPDLSVELILDCLEKSGVIENDRYCVYRTVEKHLDKEDPRVEIELSECGWEYSDKRKWKDIELRRSERVILPF